MSIQLKHFSMSEFDCKCGCGANNMNDTTLYKFDLARELAGVPFTITSGTRCIRHTKNNGWSLTSSHLKGYAGDTHTDDSRSRFLILKALLDAGFTRIGLHRKFIHADDDPHKPDQVAWFY